MSHLMLNIILIIFAVTIFAVLYNSGYLNKNYRIWSYTHSQYKNFQKETRGDCSWDRFILYYERRHSQCVGKSEEELNQKISEREELVEMLSMYGSVIEKYLQQEMFRYKKEYAEMMIEIDNFEVVNEDPMDEVLSEEISSEEVIPEDITPKSEITFEDLLLVDEDKKEALCNKIDTYIKPNVRGKGIALMILALRANSQLTTAHSNRLHYDLIRSRFKHNIGSDESVGKYLNVEKYSFSAEELESTMKIFQL